MPAASILPESDPNASSSNIPIRSSPIEEPSLDVDDDDACKGLNSEECLIRSHQLGCSKQPVQASATESKRFPKLRSTEPSSFYLRPPRSSPLFHSVYRPSQFCMLVSLVGPLRFCIDCSSPFSAIGTEMIKAQCSF
ncbi:hypothetical protein Pyn_09466 [Prunus yedoensis var. nudiflora]|uniref:Uncharacterized protein n=1 Tax=Prunus yedoensis var. nudiflora TaxID=2094558 RepID=A0A314UDE3_PRUYE|nr:hypothetical protein Pyn_09466 [Prunus yedoensis var. nudiflora]